MFKDCSDSAEDNLIPASLVFNKPEQAKVARLSDFNPDWQHISNPYGDLPDIDYAYCEPFSLLPRGSCQAIEQVIHFYQHLRFISDRAITLRGTPQLKEWFSCRELKHIVSGLAGVPLKAHTIPIEQAHINLQLEDDSRENHYRNAVDNWHFDYVPFVLICMISRHTEAPGGRICTSSREFELDPGEAILMQGSHVRHMAEKSSDNHRVTLVVSFVPDSIDHVDMTRVDRHHLPYGNHEPLFEMAVQSRFDRIRKQMLRLSCLETDSDLEKISHYISALSEELQRWKKLINPEYR
ncbi:hypothetical protein ACWJJH_12390 [Endozoicomonadaceae bacterium StTr2]